jgi:hypothetical protein
LEGCGKRGDTQRKVREEFHGKATLTTWAGAAIQEEGTRFNSAASCSVPMRHHKGPGDGA